MIKIHKIQSEHAQWWSQIKITLHYCHRSKKGRQRSSIKCRPLKEELISQNVCTLTGRSVSPWWAEPGTLTWPSAACLCLCSAGSVAAGSRIYTPCRAAKRKHNSGVWISETESSTRGNHLAAAPLRQFTSCREVINNTRSKLGNKQHTLHNDLEMMYCITYNILKCWIIPKGNILSFSKQSTKQVATAEDSTKSEVTPAHLKL